MDWGTGSYTDAAQTPLTWTLQSTSFANVVLQLAPSSDASRGPEVCIRQIETSSSFLSLGPGLVTHAFVDEAVASDAAAAKTYTYEVDCRRLYLASQPETLAAQYQLESGGCYSGPAPGKTPISEGAERGSIRHLLTPLRWLARGCTEEGMAVSQKLERLSVAGAGSLGKVVVERIVRGCTPGGDV